MVYTPSPIRSKIAPNNFGGLRNDSNRIGMTVGNAFQSLDATTSPVTSPVTIATTETLIVPTNAITFTITPVTNAVQVSEDSTQSAYFSVPAGTVYSVDCANMAFIYLKVASSTVCSFNFKTV